MPGFAGGGRTWRNAHRPSGHGVNPSSALERGGRNGYLALAEPAGFPPNWQALVQRLRELGGVEGRNLAIELRHADGRPERLDILAAESR